MPPMPTIGVAVLAATDPASSSIPITAFVVTAPTVTVDCTAAVRGVQVPVHCPPPVGVSVSGGSPLENAATTVPVSMVWAQESMIFTSIGTGSPTVALNPARSDVNTPFTCDGAQPAAAGGARRIAGSLTLPKPRPAQMLGHVNSTGILVVKL